MRGVRIVFRNLSCRVRILEFKSKVTTRFPQKRDDSEVLCGVYNNQQGGPLFCTGVLTTVWHHDFSPNSTDEIKIRLPPILTDRHWLEFEVRHVHIKLKSANGMTSWLYAKKEGGEDNKPESSGGGCFKIFARGIYKFNQGLHNFKFCRAPPRGGHQYTQEGTLFMCDGQPTWLDPMTSLRRFIRPVRSRKETKKRIPAYRTL
jgi:hypothetical protein